MRWNPCVEHAGVQVDEFVDAYFGQPERRVALIGSAGFDPRVDQVARRLVRTMGDRLTAFLIQEERPGPSATMTARAQCNLDRLEACLSHLTVLHIAIFTEDNVPIGGRDAVKQLGKRVAWANFTDVVIDLTALSLGVSFPIVRYVVEQPLPLNVHIMMCASLQTEEAICPTSSDEMRFVHGFHGEYTLDKHAEAARLWLPQLSLVHRQALRRIKDKLDPHDICPIVPFPTIDPRLTDRLIEGFMEELEDSWEVDPSSMLYAAQNDPSDLYRSLMQLHDRRQKMFRDLGKSLLVLSPLGSRGLAVGALMAAIEQNMPVAYVEALDYHVDWEKLDSLQSPQEEMIHVWLSGDAYP